MKGVKSFEELKMKGRAKPTNPWLEELQSHFPGSQDWELRNGAIWIKSDAIKDEWLELKYRDTKLLRRYLYHGWELAEELKIKLVDGRIFCFYFQEGGGG